MKTSSVYFANGARQTTVTPALWQWDYGQRLLIHGLELPTYYAVHFSHPGDSEAEIVEGDDTGFVIPDKYLETGREILAFIYVWDTEDDGCTAYMIRIPVKKRSKPGTH